MNLFHYDLLWVKIWDFGFWGNKFCLFMRIPWKGYINELNVFITLIFSVIRYVLIWFCLIKFRGRNICEILCIPSYLSNPMRTKHLLRLIFYSFVWIQYDISFLRKLKLFFINKIESWETSHSHFRSQSFVFPFRIHFNFQGKKFSF